MKISVIIPSYLGIYKNAASNREEKLIKAVTSALNQDYEDIEVIVIADGCERTFKLMDDYDVKLIYIDKQSTYSGNVRNAGIEAATGEVICYLDADDMFADGHLSTIAEHFTGEWVWFNDLTLRREQFVERECQLKLGFCGTSNIAHLRSLKARWHEKNRYGHDDWNFIQELRKEAPGVKIPTTGYVVCHIPYRRGYDV